MISTTQKGMISHWVANHGADIYRIGQGSAHLHSSTMTGKMRVSLGV